MRIDFFLNLFPDILLFVIYLFLGFDMPRKPRLHFPGRCYHVMLRGNDGQDIFFTDIDRIRMCFLIQEGVERYGHSIHAFCFMSNHVHLLIQVDEISLSKIIQNLAFRYTQYINRIQKRVGHLFQGRFRSILLDTENYFLRLIRYIHLNPVRGGLVKDPYEYRWSSHQAYLGHVDILWLSTTWGLSKFSDQPIEARKRFQEYVLKGLGEKEIEIYKKGVKEGILGSKKFIEKFRFKETQDIRFPKLSFQQIQETVCDYFDISFEELISKNKRMRFSHARALIGLMAQEFSDINLTEVAKELKRDLSTLSELCNRYRFQPKFINQISEHYERIKERFFHFE